MVFDTKADPVVVLETVIVLVDVEEPVCVLVIIDETEIAGEDDGDLDPNVERVEVFVEVIVFVEIADELNRGVGSEDFVDVVVFVDVLEEVVERVGRTKLTLSLRSTEQLTKLLSLYGGVDPTIPIANNNKNHRITVSI